MVDPAWGKNIRSSARQCVVLVVLYVISFTQGFAHCSTLERNRYWSAVKARFPQKDTLATMRSQVTYLSIRF